MFKKIVILGMLFITIISSFAGCGHDNSSSDSQETIEYSNEQTPIASSIVDVSKIADSLLTPFSARYSMSTFIPFQEVQSENIFEIVRFVDNRYYTITQLSDESYFFMLFEEIAISKKQKIFMLVDGCKIFSLMDRSEFKVNVGDLKDDVLKLDSSAYDNDSYTIHRFSDKSVVRINYIADNNGVSVVSEITELDTEHSVVSYLLPKDFALITD